MSNNTVRIRTTPNGTDKYLKVKLEQDFDFIEVLSLKISQEDAYRNFCSDYGVVTGRVIINSGFGVPNARVSIFIPIDDIDKNDPNIFGLYPYEIVSDKDNEGIRYNLLPKTSETNNDCFTPIGTFPDKRDVLDNPELLDIYCKYYKFTTTTNYAGDFMIFGVPVGTYTIHVDADISDIGVVSQRPYDSIRQGTPSKFFESPTKFKGGTNLDSLIQVKSANAGVNVQPFWGDTNSCEIGISRIDLDLNYEIAPCAIFMGSIFGDHEKNSVNKNCVPRKNIGILCEQTTNEGSIEMIRETLDGTIEKFDIEGGRVIDENGAWAYQVPMNLDYMVTDEFGNLVLSDDPNKGVPTRSSVRFRVGMDQTGDEARLRTRAKYLVPNNPNNQNEIDYEFGENTKKTSFRNLYWNKIYSVNNFIPRFQGNNGLNRDMIGIKNIDDCVGSKNPFPFNRIDSSSSGLFFIICLLIKTIGFIIYIINRLIIPVINLPILSQSRYVPCVYVRCPNDSNSSPVYAPGCRNGSKGFKALQNGCVDANESDGDVPLNTTSQCAVPTYYDGDSFGNGGFGDLCGLDDCFSNQMVQRMNLIDYQFYNDWINGTLYSFLLKYKKKRNEKEKFCEYDCDEFVNYPDSTTVDSNNNGTPDNNCNKNYIIDTCFVGNTNNQQNSTESPSYFKEGLIKKVDNEFYYAASTHNASIKLFATDLINLGSVFECDWQSVPKIQQYLVNTTYNLPPTVDEISSDNTTIITSGQLKLLYDVNCLGPHVDSRQCLNVRHICEFGVELDEYRGIGELTDNIIGVNELDTDNFSTSKLVRDVFSDLNSDSWSLSYPRSTEFNLQNCAVYDFATTAPCNISGHPSNGVDYINFRNYSLGGVQVNGGSFGQTQNSFYFYFGLQPGKSSLELMNQRFFTPCLLKNESEYFINIKSTTTLNNGNDGTVTFTINGDNTPYTATTSGPNGFTNVVILGQNNTQPTTTISGLAIGSYTITSVDANGKVSMKTFTITGPPALFADAYVSRNSTTASASNGQIVISSVGGGIGTTYSYKLFNSNCGLVSGPTNFTSVPFTIDNLPIDNSLNTCNQTNGNGYSLVINDSENGEVVINNLTVNGARPITIVPNVTQILCYGSSTGSLQINIIDGQSPYVVNTTSPEGFSSSNLIMNNLPSGVYTTEVIDSLGNHAYSTNVINYLNPLMKIKKIASEELSKQCDPNNYHIGFYVDSQWAGSMVYLDYSVDGNVDSNNEPIWTPTTLNTYVNQSTPLFLTLPSTTFSNVIKIRMTNAAKTCFSQEISINQSEVSLPITHLLINNIGIDNTHQCWPNQVKFKFNVSHLALGSTNRAPYNVTFTVKGINSFGELISNTQTWVINNNNGLIQGYVPQPNGSPASLCVVTVSIKDNKGCVSNTLQIPITLPTIPISGIWTNSSPIQSNGNVYVNKTLSVSGGIGEYSSTPYRIYNNDSNNIYSSLQSEILSSIVTDSVGCSIIANG